VCSFAQGEILISEIMPAPLGLEGVEWIELYNTTDRDLELNRAMLGIQGSGAVRWTPVSQYFSLPAKSYAVIGSAKQYFVDVEHPGLSLSNSAGSVSLKCKSELSDFFPYGKLNQLPVEEGYSLVRSGLEHTNRSWCKGFLSYDDANNHGSPGKVNIACGCVDETGMRRAIVATPLNALRINEIFPNPDGSDTGKEWIEIKNISEQRFDLHGVKITSINVATGKQRVWQTSENSCFSMGPGDLVLLSNAPLTLGTSTINFILEGENLYNDASQLVLSNADKSLVYDQVSYNNSRSGVSFNRRQEKNGQDDFCFSKSESVFEGIGSPGVENEPCGLVCLNEGSEWMPILTPLTGQVLLNEIYSNPEGTDNGRDWVELWNPSAQGVHLNGLWVSQKKDESVRRYELQSSKCLYFPAGSYFVVAGENAVLDNVRVDVMITGLDFYSSAAGIFSVENANAEAVDMAEPKNPASGVSAQVSFTTSTADVEFNNNNNNWCLSGETTKEFLGRGSPGEPNTMC